MKNNIIIRIEKLQKYLHDTNFDAFVVMNDEDSNWESLFYLSGFRGTCGVLLVYRDSAELILDGRYAQQGREQSPVEVFEMQQGIAEDVRASLEKHCAKHIFCEAEKTSHSLWCAAMPENTNWVGIDDFLMDMRRTKDAAEIMSIQQSAKIASSAFMNTLDSVCEGMKEKDVEALLNYNINRLGAETGFDMIVASGVRSAMPHGRATEKEIKRGEIVTVDFGARVNGYFCDITRNFVIGKAETRAKELHDILLATHISCANAIHAGVVGTDIQKMAENLLSVYELDKYFTHGLGHGFGLSIHEYGLLSRRQKMTLRENDVVTVEPGVYIEGWGGLRLEDDYCVTAQGAERLTNMLEQKLYEL